MQFERSAPNNLPEEIYEKYSIYCYNLAAIASLGLR